MGTIRQKLASVRARWPRILAACLALALTFGLGMYVQSRRDVARAEEEQTASLRAALYGLSEAVDDLPNLIESLEDSAPIPPDYNGAFTLLRLRAGAALEQLHRSSGTVESLAHWYLYDLCGYLCDLEFSTRADLEDAYDTAWPLVDAAASKFRGGAMPQVEERLATDKGQEILGRMGTPNVTQIMQGGT